ncbi:6765_t:CDS:2, partial [Dentiscutata erythropus]
HTYKNRSYIIAFKLDIIAYAKETSNCHASIFYKVDRRRVQEWRQQKSKLEALKENKDINIDQTRVLSGCGRKAIYPGLEKELVDYIKKKREEKLAVTTSMIRKKAKELGKTLDIRDAKFSRSWCDRFRKRHGLMECTRTQIVQKFPENMPLVIRDFLEVSHEKTNVIEKQFIISFDEMPMCFGLHSFWSKTSAYAAPHANIKGDLMISTYIPQAIRSRPNGFFKSKGIIFVDGHRSHVRDDVKKAFKAEGLDLLEIPGGTTSILQPPDVSVNKPFKNGEISSNILVRSFEAAGLTLNPDGSENDKMSQCLQAIVQAVAKNRTNELNMNELLDVLPEDKNESVMDVENQTDNEENTTDETDSENAMDYKYVMDNDERMIE